MRSLIIDNYDSFTYNLVQGIGALGGSPRVFRNDRISLAEIERLQPTHIVISPGPGSPDDGGISGAVVRRFSGRIPLLGVCLGHQIISREWGARVERAPQPVHGKDVPIYHRGEGIWQNLPSPLRAARYHSLTVDASSLPPELILTAWTECGLVMAVQHREFPLFGFQFHPESIMTAEGMTLLQRFLQVRSSGGAGGRRDLAAGAVPEEVQ